MSMLTDERYRKVVEMGVRMRGIDQIGRMKFERTVATDLLVIRPQDSLPDLSPSVHSWIARSCDGEVKLRYDLRSSRFIIGFTDEVDYDLFLTAF